MRIFSWLTAGILILGMAACESRQSVVIRSVVRAELVQSLPADPENIQVGQIHYQGDNEAMVEASYIEAGTRSLPPRKVVCRVLRREGRWVVASTETLHSRLW